METGVIIGFSVLSYLLGSLPSAVWVGKAFYGVDVRKYGSGNAGATNTFRVLGKKAGCFVMLLDIMKGFTAASLVRLIGSVEFNSNQYVNLQLMFGIISVIGHIFPVYENFKGGKGIATLFGMIIAIHYASALICLALFLVILLLTRYVSLSSISAAVAFPLFVVFIFHQKEPLFVAFGITTAILVLVTHQKNIKKLLNGNENKTNLFKRN